MESLDHGMGILKVDVTVFVLPSYIPVIVTARGRDSHIKRTACLSYLLRGEGV